MSLVIKSNAIYAAHVIYILDSLGKLALRWELLVRSVVAPDEIRLVISNSNLDLNTCS